MTEQASSDLYDLVDVISGQFAGLALSLDRARLWRAEFPHRMAVVPVSYRTPQISTDEAKARASPLLHEQQHGYPNVIFDEEVRLYAHHPMVYTFVSFGEEWQREGRVPGGLLCSIDKVDGHVWTETERERYLAANLD